MRSISASIPLRSDHHIEEDRTDLDEVIVHILLPLPKLLPIDLLKLLSIRKLLAVLSDRLESMQVSEVAVGSSLSKVEGGGEMVEGVEEDEGDEVSLFSFEGDVGDHG